MEFFLWSYTSALLHCKKYAFLNHYEIWSLNALMDRIHHVMHHYGKDMLNNELVAHCVHLV